MKSWYLNILPIAMTWRWPSITCFGPATSTDVICFQERGVEVCDYWIAFQEVALSFPLRDSNCFSTLTEGTVWCKKRKTCWACACNRNLSSGGNKHDWSKTSMVRGIMSEYEVWPQYLRKFYVLKAFVEWSQP
jgi:hypothetical protein